jgi:hypothetical protein
LVLVGLVEVGPQRVLTELILCLQPLPLLGAVAVAVVQADLVQVAGPVVVVHQGPAVLRVQGLLVKVLMVVTKLMAVVVVVLVR